MPAGKPTTKLFHEKTIAAACLIGGLMCISLALAQELTPAVSRKKPSQADYATTNSGETAVMPKAAKSSEPLRHNRHKFRRKRRNCPRWSSKAGPRIPRPGNHCFGRSHR